MTSHPNQRPFPPPPPASGFYSSPVQYGGQGRYYILPHQASANMSGTIQNSSSNLASPVHPEDQAAQIASNAPRGPTFGTTYVPAPIQTTGSPQYRGLVSPIHRGSIGRPELTSPQSRQIQLVHSGNWPPFSPSEIRNHPAPFSPVSPPKHSVSAEQQLKSIPYLKKIQMLRSISPPFQSDSIEDQTTGTCHRGPIIAIEGDNESSMANIVTWLCDYLSTENCYDVRALDGVVNASTDKASIAGYHELILDWLTYKRQELLEFITSSPKTIKPVAEDATEKDGRLASPGKSGEPHDYSCAASQADMEEQGKQTEEKSLLPIVLIKQYQLHATDTHASLLPISDNYTLIDHWKWVATMWRGVIGPDITVFVKDCEAEELKTERAVDVREDIQCITVRRDKSWKEGAVDETTTRRLCFELGEIVRTRKFGTSKAKTTPGPLTDNTRRMS